MTEVTKFLKLLNTAKLTAQQKRTLKGLALSGDMVGAYNGLHTCLLKKR